MFSGLEEYTSILNEFVRCCKEVGRDITLVQGKGGNISSKFVDNTMMIKASGSLLKEVYHSNGFAMLDYEIISNRYALTENMTELEMCELIDESTHTGYENPSMETAFHAILPGDVIHTHPLYLNVILCSQECEELLDKLVKGNELIFDWIFIDYATPGNELAEEIIDKKRDGAVIYFLKNHGLIICNQTLEAGLKMTNKLNSKAKELLNLPDYEEKNDFEDFESYLFPDDVLFLKTSEGYDIELANIHNYIIESIKENGLTPSYLTEEQCISVRNSILEKKRLNK
jgi:rhamnose utilization protein RhaD (predicted bifunctional aldolase and dehydrogenase)